MSERVRRLFGAGRIAHAPFDSSRPLVFMHIPKTAGSSLVAGLVQALQPPRVVSGFDRVLFGTYDDFASFDFTTRQAIFLTPPAMPPADLVVGHIGFATLRERYGQAQFTTVLREPVSRLLSHWLFWRGHDDARLAEWGSWAQQVRRARLPLATFLAFSDLACQNDNQAIRLLLSPHKLIPEGGFIDPRHDRILFKDAVACLQRFAFVDLVENPDFIASWQAWLGVKLALPKLNETAAIPAALRHNLETALTSETMDRLEQLSRLDLRLWQHLARQQGLAAQPLRDRTLLRNAARYATLMC